jgi:mRNA-degrading endonuclease RelE of RelBE toxin-antitoxin system
MDFRIADTFTDSLVRLTGDEQKAVKTTAFDLQLNPANPGMSFHKLDRAKDKSFWSVRVNNDIRLIVHRTDRSLLLCYVGHHDGAYAWAERRKLETHPKTGAAQLVVIRETVQEIVVPQYVAPPSPATGARPIAVLAHCSEDELLSFGVPQEWISDVRGATETTILTIADHLPQEAAEAVLELATGGQPKARVVAAPVSPGGALVEAVPATQLPVDAVIPVPSVAPIAFDHPDAQRRFRLLANVEELQRALEFPWEKWTVFLHPDQRQWAERDYSGPARVSGSAGTGKTVVALHRAAHLARSNPDTRVLLTTFSDTLANALRTKLRRLLSSEPRLAERIDVYSLNAIGERLYSKFVGTPALVSPSTMSAVLAFAAEAVGEHKFGASFIRSEWDHVVDAWQLRSWEAYRDVARLGRKTRLPETQRRILWAIFEKAWQELESKALLTHAGLFAALTAAMSQRKAAPFDFVIVDEAQDISVSQLRFLAAVAAGQPNALFFAGDLGQRIYQQPFSWLALGVDVRGRSRTLRVNYRTTHQIRMHADRLLSEQVVDIDGVVEQRNNTVSVFNGPDPVVRVFGSAGEESEAVGRWIAEQVEAGVLPHEIGVFVRSSAQIGRATAAVRVAGVKFKILDDHVETVGGSLSVSTMHLAKGLEFRAVAVMSCDDEVIPLQERIEEVGDMGDLKEVYDTERQLLYVACTRARDCLIVTGVVPASEFLDDLATKRFG